MMWEQLSFQKKGLFLQSLHPVAALTYLAALLGVALLFTHPLGLLGLLLVILLALQAADALKAWQTYFQISLVIAAVIMVVNPLLTRSGESIIWRGPELPLLGALAISLEAVAYGGAMCVRLLDVVGIFCLYNSMVHPDQVVHIFSRLAFKSALVLSLATRMFPALVRRLVSIQEVYSLRGLDFHTGRWLAKLRNYGLLLNVLLLSSLEDSLDIAEAMQARGFGSGRRTSYRQYIWRPRDTFCLAGTLLGSALAVYSRIKGHGNFAFYPRLGDLIPNPGTFLLLATTVGALAIPVLLSWGWQHCTCIRSKI